MPVGEAAPASLTRTLGDGGVGGVCSFLGTTCYFAMAETLGEYGHDADVGLVDGFLGYLQRATTMSITVLFTLLGCVKVLVSETAELALEHSPALPFQFAYHLQTSKEGALCA